MMMPQCIIMHSNAISFYIWCGILINSTLGGRGLASTMKQWNPPILSACLYLLRSQIFYEQQCLAATSSIRRWIKDAWHDQSWWQRCWQWHRHYFCKQVEEEQPEQETQNPLRNTSRPHCQHSPLPASTVLHVRRHSTQPRRSQCWLPIVEQEDLPTATLSQRVWNFDHSTRMAKKNATKRQGFLPLALLAICIDLLRRQLDVMSWCTQFKYPVSYLRSHL